MENYFILLELPFDLPESDTNKISEAISKKQAQWSRDQSNPVKKAKASEYLAALEDIKKVMLDPTARKQEAAKAKQIKASKANTILNRTIEIVRTGSGLTNLSKKIDIPIAIAFTKIDAVDELLDPASCLKNDSAHIRKGAFDKIDFEDANNEMQSLVESWLGMELYQTVSTQFSNFAFFGLSALGSNPDMDNKIPKFRPFRVADPFLWILSQEHIIPTE